MDDCPDLDCSFSHSVNDSVATCDPLPEILPFVFRNGLSGEGKLGDCVDDRHDTAYYGVRSLFRCTAELSPDIVDVCLRER